jgi:hypothetical protein
VLAAASTDTGGWHQPPLQHPCYPRDPWSNPKNIVIRHSTFVIGCHPTD